MNLLTHLHPALVHFPIALLLVASAAGLTYLFVWPRGELRLITWSAALAGWVACAVAVANIRLLQRERKPSPAKCESRCQQI